MQNNEIKEILAYFEKYVKITDMHDSEPMLNWKDLKIVLDYITNLQEQLHQASLDIQELTERDIECPSCCDKLTNLQQKLEKYKSRIEKAIEYINHLSKEPNVFGHYGIHNDCAKWLLNILNGKE